MSRARPILIVSVLAAPLAACGTSPADTVTTDQPDSGSSDSGSADVSAPEDVLTADDVASNPLWTEFDCAERGVIWTAPHFERWLEPAWIGFSPNNALAMLTFHGGFGATAWRLADGMSISGGGTTPIAMSDDWSTIAQPGEDSVLEVRVGPEPAITIDPPELIPGWLSADVSADGSRIAVATCTNDAHFVALVDLDASPDVSWIEYPAAEGECYSYPHRPLVEFVPDGRAVLFGPAAGARVARIDLTDNTTVWIDTHGPGAPLEDGTPVAPDLYALAVHPAGTEFATTGSDLVLRRWSLPAMTPLGSEIEVGAETLNEMTYAPWWVASPIAYSPAGTYIAHVAPSLDAVVRRLDDMSEFAVIPREAIAVPEDEFPPDDNAFAVFAFTPDGQDLLLVNQHGAAFFGCRQTLPTVVDVGELVVTGPTSGRPTGTAHFEITLPEDFDRESVVRVTVDGGDTYHDVRDLSFSWYLDTSRTYTFEFVATDGVRQARATWSLTI